MWECRRAVLTKGHRGGSRRGRRLCRGPATRGVGGASRKYGRLRRTEFPQKAPDDLYEIDRYSTIMLKGRFSRRAVGRPATRTKFCAHRTTGLKLAGALANQHLPKKFAERSSTEGVAPRRWGVPTFYTQTKSASLRSRPGQASTDRVQGPQNGDVADETVGAREGRSAATRNRRTFAQPKDRLKIFSLPPGIFEAAAGKNCFSGIHTMLLAAFRCPMKIPEHPKP